MGSKSLALQIAKMSSEEVQNKLTEVLASPWKLPKSKTFQFTMPANTEEALAQLRMINSSSAGKLEAQIRALNPPNATQLKEPTPPNWHKYEKYLPKPVVEHVKAEYDRRMDYINRAFDPAPVIDLYNRIRLEELINAKEKVARLSEEYDRIIPEIEKVNKLIDELPNLTVEELLLRNPEVDTEIQQEIADSQWAPEGRLHEEEHHHH